MKVLIIGWYGTETVGDKAILAGIVQDYLRRSAETQLTIASIYPFITRRTLQELGIAAKIIPTYSLQFVRACASSDEVVMGGGPLMDLDALSIPLWGFAIARIFRKKRIIWGCGLGPLKHSQYVEAVKRILRSADEVSLRDRASVAFAQRLVPRDDYKLVSDPAKDYVLSMRSTVQPAHQTRRIALFLRDWPRSYAANLSDAEFEHTKEQFQSNLGEYLVNIARQYDAELCFYAMHAFSVGEDDRSFNRRFITAYLRDVKTHLETQPSTVISIIQAMESADVCICMRYHSVLFAHTLGREFAAIDYTLGGKVEGYLKDADALNHYIGLREIAAGHVNKLEKIVGASFKNAHT